MLRREQFLPYPKSLDVAAGGFLLPLAPPVAIQNVTRSTALVTKLTTALRARGLEPVFDAAAPAIRVTVTASATLPVDGYELHVTESSVQVSASSEAGAFYGICTLAQLIGLAPEDGAGVRLPALVIRDFPDFAARGVMLDVSRDRVPRMDTLFCLIDKLAGFKINQLQLYMEHTFAYAGHETVWRDASPFTPSELDELDRYTADRFIELVPNQNSFGHMQRWVTHARYRPLAECPDGFEHPWNPTREPYGLCATDPASLAFLDELYGQLLPHFRSTQFNVGLDETIDLGLGRSAAECAERGTERVYLEFLHRIHGLLAARGKKLQFWGDIINNKPELIPELPRDAVALEWGYEAEHPFAERAQRYRESQLQFYVCPGTSSWNSIGGRTGNAIANICSAATAGYDNGAHGLLVTDWGDNGHLQPQPVSELGLVLSALVSWDVNAARQPEAIPLSALLDRYSFADESGTLGQLVYDLGQVYALAGAQEINCSLLFSLLTSRDGHYDPTRVSIENLESALARVRELRGRLPSARPSGPDGALVLEELAWVARAMEFGCLLGLERAALGFDAPLSQVPAQKRLVLSRMLAELLEQHTRNWLRRSRPGGLRDSRRRLEQTLMQLVP